jgi:gamma-butyrobetaine dioxygenase
MYMHQPPHLQFLHCIRSSAAGGASLFTDSYRAIEDLAEAHPAHLSSLRDIDVSYHYNHLEKDYYHQSRPVITLKKADLSLKQWRGSGVDGIDAKAARIAFKADHIKAHIASYIDEVAWSPPFQAPFQYATSHRERALPKSEASNIGKVNTEIGTWHSSAKVFNQLIHRPEGIYERMMRPGECVLFDNRRVLHARKAFAEGDAGRERWLRGAYLDRDPFESKLMVLQHRFS